MNQSIIHVVLPENKVRLDWQWTFWKEPCDLILNTHYTFGIEDTVKHAREFHPQSSFSYDPVYKTIA
jgi:hypothetical protein